MKRQMRGIGAHQLKNCNLHHTLIEVCWLVFDNLNRNNFMRFHVLTLDYLTERPLP